MKKLITRLYINYLLNYKGIHHFISLSFLFIFLYFIFGIEIFSNFYICIFLPVNYIVTNWTLKKVGLDKEIEKELKRLFPILP